MAITELYHPRNVKCSTTASGVYVHRNSGIMQDAQLQTGLCCEKSSLQERLRFARTESEIALQIGRNEVIDPAITFSSRRQEKALKSKDRLGLHLTIVTIDKDE